MINVCIYKNEYGDICGFEMTGHSDFDEEGSDIVCAAVSILVINTINSIDSFLEEEIIPEADETRGGFLRIIFPRIQEGGQNPELSLVLRVMEKGLKDTEAGYGKFIKIVTKEVPKC